MIPSPTFEDYVLARRTEINIALEAALPSPPRCPPHIAEAMRYSVFGGGKRFRPIVTLAAAEVVADAIALNKKTAIARAMPGACAIELIHTYSLVHDDLPAMDDDALRRGQPTAHVKFGEGVAILVGDALLTQAFAVLATPHADESEGRQERRLQALVQIAEAAGAGGMVGGQLLDLAATGTTGASPPEPASGPHTPTRSGQDTRNDRFAAADTDALREIHERKTGALIRAAAVAGAILAGGRPDEIEAISQYATHLGLAFQIVDDILDVEGTAAELGKTAGKDAAADKPTYPALYGLIRARTLARDAVAASHDTLSTAGLNGQLHEIAEWVLSRTH